MEYRKIGATYVLRMERGEEIIAGLRKLAADEKIGLAYLTGIGAADHVSMGLYDVGNQRYVSVSMDKPLEITSLVGNITEKDGDPYIHVHINLSDEEGKAFGGHLTKAVIGGTSEIFVQTLEGHVGRKLDDITGTGLNLLSFD